MAATRRQVGRGARETATTSRQRDELVALVARFERIAIVMATLRDSAQRVDELLHASGAGDPTLDA